jgi:acetyl esterase/lipase
VRRAVLAVLCLAAAACGGGHHDPGELLDDDDVELDGGVAAVRIRYASVDVRGDGNDVTGLVVVPPGEAPSGGWPIVAYAHSTTGAADSCAPSDDPDLAGVGGVLARLASNGFLAVATDYEGIGTGGDHPYLHGASEARAIVDSVRAVRALVPGAGARWAVVGHSQGGHAAAFTAELGAELAPELELVGSVAIAPVAEPAGLVAGSAFLVLTVIGYLAATPDADDDELLTEAARDAVDAAEDDCTVPPIEGPVLAREDPDLAAYLAANAIGQQAASVPVLVHQGDDDELTPAAGAGEAAARMCALGGTIELRVYRDAGHSSIVDASFDDALAWVRARFAGEPAVSTCDQA